jgi:hypothetical protein
VAAAKSRASSESFSPMVLPVTTVRDLCPACIVAQTSRLAKLGRGTLIP